MSSYKDTEESILELFKESKEFIFEQDKYEITDIGKPRPDKGTGECKTDIYILTKNRSTCLPREFKISIKKTNADFLENKMSLERAIEFFGEDAKDVMIKSIKSIKESFFSDKLIYFKKHKRTDEKCLKIGWRFDLLDKKGGDKSGLLVLTDEQKVDVYSGSNTNIDKKNSIVNGSVVRNSGVANFILIVDDTDEELDFYINNLKSIEEFAITQDIYFACKAINYRSKHDKWDGDRSLSVFIKWSLVNKILFAEFVMDKPLEVKANIIGYNIRDILNKLNISSENFIELKKIIDKNINFAE
jgi:hypothetical protein